MSNKDNYTLQIDDVERRLIVVVLPAPLGPRRPKNSPVSIFRSRESTAVKLSKVFVRFLVSIICAPLQ